MTFKSLFSLMKGLKRGITALLAGQLMTLRKKDTTMRKNMEETTDRREKCKIMGKHLLNFNKDIVNETKQSTKNIDIKNIDVDGLMGKIKETIRAHVPADVMKTVESLTSQGTEKVQELKEIALETSEKVSEKIEDIKK